MVGGQRHFDVGRHSELEPLREKTVALGDHLARVGTLLHLILDLGNPSLSWLIGSSILFYPQGGPSVFHRCQCGINHIYIYISISLYYIIIYIQDSVSPSEHMVEIRSAFSSHGPKITQISCVALTDACCLRCDQSDGSLVDSREILGFPG